VPTLHAKVVPAVRSALSGLWDVARDRHKRLELFGGNGASGAALRPRPRATCLAYGVDLNLAQLVFVNTAASVLSFLVPTPVASGPLRRASRPASSRWGRQADRLAIAITQRLWTFDLPPIWGYVSLRWLSRRGYI
jgi:hypothetical protein